MILRVYLWWLGNSSSTTKISDRKILNESNARNQLAFIDAEGDNGTNFMSKHALKLINSSRFYVDEGEFWQSDEDNSHSLHYALSLPESFSPTLVSYFIKKYSTKNDIILDPFCGRGTVPLEAALYGRTAYASDVNPLCSKVTKAKLLPADLVEVALAVQSINFSRPVSLNGYSEYFEPFYDPDTYREIINLKNYIQNSNSDVSSFIEIVAAGLLHGHTAGYLSAYSLPQISVTPKRQIEINNRRGKIPEYRAVAPRLLRKAGSVLRDGDVARLKSSNSSQNVYIADGRNLFYLKNSSVDLVITAPPLPYQRSFINDLWLKSWFVGLSKSERDELIKVTAVQSDHNVWLKFMNEFFVELSRVVKSGGRAVLDLKEVSLGNEVILPDQLILELIHNNPSSPWECESLCINRLTVPQLAKRLSQGDSTSRSNRVLVLRRK